jgi:RNA recognition motif-containing protein
METTSSLQPYYVINSTGAAQGTHQQQQKQQKGVHQNASGAPGARPPVNAFAETPQAQFSSVSHAAAPFAYASLSVQQPNSMPLQDAQLSSSNPQSGVINQLPAHYALSSGQLVYLPSATAPPSSYGQQQQQQQIFGSPSASNINIMPANTHVIYPAMSVPSTGGSGATVAYYVPTTANLSQRHPQQRGAACSIPAVPTGSPHAGRQASATAVPAGPNFYFLRHTPQQQQQHSFLLNASSASSLPNADRANPPLSYFVTPTQPVDRNSMASLAPYSSLPFAPTHALQMAPPSSASMIATYELRPPSTHQQQQQVKNFSKGNGGAAAWPAAPALHHTRPPPLQSFATPPVAPSAGKEKPPTVPGSRYSAMHASTHKGEVPLSASLASHSPAGSGGTSMSSNSKCTSSSAMRRRRSSNSVDAGAQSTNGASAASQSTSSAQGLPYALDPVEIDITKRQLIVNYLPQRLTDERFKELFRPYGELEEENSHIMYDFRHHKMVTMPSSVTADVPSSAGQLTASNTTPLSFDKDLTPSLSATPATTLSNRELTSPGVLVQDDIANTDGTTSATAAAMASTTTTTRSMPRSKGYGFIYYKDGASTERAIKELNGKEVDGKRIKVRYAEQQRCLDAQPAEAGKEEKAETAQVSTSDVDVQLRSAASDSDEESEVGILDLGAFKMDDE